MFISKRVCLVITVLAVSVSSCVSRPYAFNSDSLDKNAIKIAVLNFRDYNSTTGNNNNSGELVRNLFEGKLQEYGYKTVGIEKVNPASILETLEKNRQNAQWFIDTGKSIGADYIIYGSVHDYSVYQSYTTFIYIFGWLELTSSVGVTARMVSCATGEVVWSGSITRLSYTFNDAAEESVYELIRTIKHRPVKKTE